MKNKRKEPVKHEPLIPERVKKPIQVISVAKLNVKAPANRSDEAMTNTETEKEKEKENDTETNRKSKKEVEKETRLE